MIIQQGAEAIIKLENNKIIKDRVKKGYRIAQIDEKLRKLRTRTEARILEKASKLIPVPKVLKVDEAGKQLEIGFIDGKKLSESLDNLKNKEEIMKKAGKQTAILHDNNIIHGDLTTSNMIYLDNSDKTNNKLKNSSAKRVDLAINNFKLYFIDFGLSFSSTRIEDRAVDLHLIKQALEARHFLHHEKLFQAFLEGYKESKNYKQTIEQLKKVEARGRYKN